MKTNYRQAVINYSQEIRKHFYKKVSSKKYLTIFQMFSRAFAIDNKDFLLLHASSAITKYGHTVLFGDDGANSAGKTLLSLATAAESKFYIADEYCLYDKKQNVLIGNGNIPVNLKTKTRPFILKKYNLDLGRGKIIFANDYFKIAGDKTLDLIIIPYLNSPSTNIIVPSKKEHLELLKATINGHRMKFFDRRLDHLYSNGKNQSILFKKQLEEYTEEIPISTPVIKIFIKNFDEIPNLLNKIYSNISEYTKQYD